MYGIKAKLSPKFFFKLVVELKEIAFAIIEVEWTCNTYLKSIKAWKDVSVEGLRSFLEIISLEKLSSCSLFIFFLFVFFL